MLNLAGIGSTTEIQHIPAALVGTLLQQLSLSSFRNRTMLLCWCLWGVVLSSVLDDVV